MPVDAPAVAPPAASGAESWGKTLIATAVWGFAAYGGLNLLNVLLQQGMFGASGTISHPIALRVTGAVILARLLARFFARRRADS